VFSASTSGLRLDARQVWYEMPVALEPVQDLFREIGDLV
jgi:hypothetical protein